MEKMIIRKYQPADCKTLTELFYDTVHTVNAADYTEEQLNAWTAGNEDVEEWNQALLESYSLVALKNDVIIGFGNICENGYLDRLYVHKDYQRKGVATAICDRLEEMVQGKMVTHASITARPFFEKRGYRVIKKQQVKRQGVILENFVMEK